ncbi:hypothetical protein OH77DRAFT_1513693 [Trametes cingulata]|nr:hypothetical protein OH77DRAFT_1513693 [Trametes cingulata]
MQSQFDSPIELPSPSRAYVPGGSVGNDMTRNSADGNSVRALGDRRYSDEGYIWHRRGSRHRYASWSKALSIISWSWAFCLAASLLCPIAGLAAFPDNERYQDFVNSSSRTSFWAGIAGTTVVGILSGVAWYCFYRLHVVPHALARGRAPEYARFFVCVMGTEIVFFGAMAFSIGLALVTPRLPLPDGLGFGDVILLYLWGEVFVLLLVFVLGVVPLVIYAWWAA